MINCWPKVVAELPLKTNNASKNVLSKNTERVILHFPTVNTVRVGRKQGREKEKGRKVKLIET